MADDTHTKDAADATLGAGAPRDMSAYFRTYAKDYAQAAGAPAPAGPAPASTPAPQPRPDEVVLPTVEEPFFERPSQDTQKLYETPEALPSRADLDSVIDRAPAAAAPIPVSSRESMMPQAAIPVAAAASNAPEEKREDILARLRQKVSERAQMEVGSYPAPARPEPATPEVSVTPARKPIGAWPAAPMPDPAIFVPRTIEPVKPVPAPLPPPPPIAPPIIPTPPPAVLSKPPLAPKKPDTFSPEPFHSFKTDFDDRLKDTDGSRLSVIAAGQDARAARPARSAPKKRIAIVPILLGILLIALGSFGAYAGYGFLVTHRAVPLATPLVPSLVFADEYQEIEGGEGANAAQELAGLAREALPTDTVLVAYVMQSVTGDKGVLSSIIAPGSVLAKAALAPAPSILLRNIADASTVGIIHAGTETGPFFALRVTSYERTFAGMLTWEPVLLRDLAALYPSYPEDAIEVPVLDAGATASTTSSTTPAALPPAQARTRFEDGVVANHDVRVLRDTRGRSLVVYGYADKETLVIARDEAAFSALLTRLSAAAK